MRTIFVEEKCRGKCNVFIIIISNNNIVTTPFQATWYVESARIRICEVGCLRKSVRKGEGFVSLKTVGLSLVLGRLRSCSSCCCFCCFQTPKYKNRKRKMCNVWCVKNKRAAPPPPPLLAAEHTPKAKKDTKNLIDFFTFDEQP